MTETKMDRAADPGVHGCVLNKYEVARIREALKALDPAFIKALADERMAEAGPSLSMAFQLGAYRGAAEDARKVIAQVLDCADLSCERCAPDCGEVTR